MVTPKELRQYHEQQECASRRLVGDSTSSMETPNTLSVFHADAAKCIAELERALEQKQIDAAVARAAEGEEPVTQCEVCRMPVMSGSRHHFCGHALLSRDARIAELERENERVRIELRAARRRADGTTDMLLRIHALLYPSLSALPNGTMMAFRPKSIDPHEVLQEISDRIRALPNEIYTLDKALGKG